MIINDFNFMDAIVAPFKTDAPLIINANSELSLSYSFKTFQPIGWRNTEVVQGGRPMDKDQFSFGDSLDIAG